MSRQETLLIRKHLKPEHVMLEFGSGGSTLYFSQYVKRYVSVEHNVSWFNRVSRNLPENAEIFLRPPNQKVSMRLIRRCTYEQFKDYIDILGTLDLKLDRVLIDGRARVACAEHVIPYLEKDAIVFIHDYPKRRKHYKAVEEHYDTLETIERGQSIASFTLKK